MRHIGLDCHGRRRRHLHFRHRFLPLAASALTATVTATYGNGAASGQTASATLNGTGLAVANLTYSPTSYNFGDAQIGAAALTQSIIITNSGLAQATGVYIAVSGSANFTAPAGTSNCGVSGTPITLSAGASCTFVANFTAATVTAQGSSTATVTAN